MPAKRTTKTKKVEPKNEIEPKTLKNTCVDGAKENVTDLVVYGNGDLFKLLSKAYSEKEGWMKSTKAMDVGTGSVIQVTTQQRNPDGSYSVAEALTFVPGVRVKGNAADGYRLIDGSKL